MDEYDPKVIEPKWQQIWEAEDAFEVANEPRRPTSYVLEQLPYPSGSLHMGHLLPYTIGDVVTHFRRRQGMHVLHPMGFDSFGLPAENAAIKDGGDQPVKRLSRCSWRSTTSAVSIRRSASPRRWKRDYPITSGRFGNS